MNQNLRKKWGCNTKKWRFCARFLGVKKGVAEGLRLLSVFKKARELLAQKLRRINKERAFQQSRKRKKNVSGLSQQGVVLWCAEKGELTDGSEEVVD
ncbi:hypothetical protein [Acutalibacter caecimuris]|uniref:hypothetical protein n=1 Tax=Acutalibacter caecimuris TaxID=3093657 RepID=UPI002AC961D6|nr:hypothetical protein [Acutalibacter sp. M00118]